MILQGLKYTGNRDLARLVVRTLNPTHPQRKQVFKSEEVKLLGRDIQPELAEYLASEYRGVVEFVEVKVDAKVLFGQSLQQIKEEYGDHVSPNDAMTIFCTEFELSSPLQELKKKNGELETALKELTELKTQQEGGKAEEKPEAKEPKKPKAKPKRKRKAAKGK